LLHLRPGEIFASDFRIERPLAVGGMGAVYVVEQLSTGRKRALKLMLPSVVENPRTRERFEQEARVASQIASDHVVEVVAAGIDGTSGTPWLAMELLEGETLSARIARGGPLAPVETLEVFRQMCHALGAAHAAGLVHRDIKPDNIYLAAPRREGVPFTLKILDFGIAKLNENAQSGGDTTRAVGSPLWMPPEQTSAGAVLPTADVWALGLVAFHCLTGRNYWRSGNSEHATLQELLREVVIDPLEPASRRSAALGVAHLLPEGFDAWFAHTVARDPRERFPDAAATLAALVPVLSGAGAWSAPPVAATTAGTHASAAATLPRAVPTRSSSSKGLVVGLVAFLGLGVLGVIGVAAFVVLGAGYYVASEPVSSAAPVSASATTPSAAPEATGSATATAAPNTRSPTTSSPKTPRAASAAKTSATPSAKASTAPKAPSVPAGYLKLGMSCAKNTSACIPCCKSGDYLSAFPECECYFKPPATSKPAGAKPRGMGCSKTKTYCAVNCCQPGDFLSPFPECACYFLPPTSGVQQPASKQ